MSGLWTKNECVQHLNCVYIRVVFLSKCVRLLQKCGWRYINLGMIMSGF